MMDAVYHTVMVLSLAALVGCDQNKGRQVSPKDSFQQLVAEFEAKSVNRNSKDVTIAVSGEYRDPSNSAEPCSGVIRVRKETIPDAAKGRKSSLALYEVHFVYDAGAWHCKIASSQDLDEGKVTGENALRGPDVRLENLFIWIGL